MTKLEITCVIIGLIGMILSHPTKMGYCKSKADIVAYIALISSKLAFLSMIILPLYFRLWRR